MILTLMKHVGVQTSVYQQCLQWLFLTITNKCIIIQTNYLSHNLPATVTLAWFLNFSVLSLFNKCKENCTKNTKCSCDRCEGRRAVYFTHCKYELTCSHISVLIPYNPVTLKDLKLLPHRWVMLWNRSCQIWC